MRNHSNRMKLSSVSRSHQDARRAYDRLSGIYDWLAAGETPYRRKAVEMLAPQREERVLEIGCGTGEILVDVSGRCRQVIGIDISPRMAARAAGKLRKGGSDATAWVGVANALSIPFARDSFDAVLMTFTLELFDTPEIPRLLEECRRVVCDGGRLGVAAMDLPFRKNLMVRGYEWFHDRYPAWADCRPIPASEMVRAAGFVIGQEWTGSLWGLPVVVLVANKE